MKKMILFALTVLASVTSFSQQIEKNQVTNHPDYQAKSRNQKKAACVLLGGGTALIATGLLIGNKEESSFDEAATGGIIAGIGLVSAITSIPLFIASGRNKKRAMDVSVHLENQQYPSVQPTVFTSKSLPALSIKLCF